MDYSKQNTDNSDSDNLVIGLIFGGVFVIILLAIYLLVRYKEWLLKLLKIRENSQTQNPDLEVSTHNKSDDINDHRSNDNARYPSQT